MSEQMETKKKISAKSLLAPKNLAFAALVFLVLAACVEFFGGLVSLVQTGYNLESAIRALTSDLIGIAYWVLPGLLMPVCLFLVDDNANKKSFAKILFFVAAGFVAIQLLCAMIMAIYALAEGEYGSFIMMANSVSGSRLLSCVVYMFKNLFSGMRFVIVLRNMTVNLCGMLSNLLYILANAVCAFGFIKMFTNKE